MKGIIRKTGVLALAAALALTVSACGNENAMKRIEQSGKLVVGTSADYAPYEYHAVINGKDMITGLDISIANEIAKDLGVQLEIVDMGFDSLLPALNKDKVDIVISGMNPDEDKKKSVDFSKVYYESKLGVLIRAEDKDKINAIDNLSDKKVGAQAGTQQEKAAKEQMKDSELVTAGKIQDLVMKLKNKEVDVLVLELAVADGYVKNNNDLALSDIQVKGTAGSSAVAVKKGNAELVQIVDKTLDRLKSDGSIDKFVQDANEQNITRQ